MGFADQGVSTAFLGGGAAPTARSCAQGGEQKHSGGPSGYVLIWAENLDPLFENSEPAVVDEVARLHERDPCGDGSSLPGQLVTAPLADADITAPVLLLTGDRDEMFANPPLALETQRSYYRGSKDVTVGLLKNTGHMLMAQRTAAEFRARVSAWLKKRGF